MIDTGQKLAKEMEIQEQELTLSIWDEWCDLR